MMVLTASNPVGTGDTRYKHTTAAIANPIAR